MHFSYGGISQFVLSHFDNFEVVVIAGSVDEFVLAVEVLVVSYVYEAGILVLEASVELVGSLLARNLDDCLVDYLRLLFRILLPELVHLRKEVVWVRGFFFADEQLQSALWEVEEILDVHIVCLARLVNFEAFDVDVAVVFGHMLSSRNGPSVESLELAQSVEKAVFLAPDHVVTLLAHSEEVNCVAVANGHHDQLVEVLNERNSLRKLGVLKLLVEARKRLLQEVGLNLLVVEEAADVEDVQARLLLLLNILHRGLIRGAWVVGRELDGLRSLVDQGVHVGLVHVLDVLKRNVFKLVQQLALLIVDHHAFVENPQQVALGCGVVRARRKHKIDVPLL